METYHGIPIVDSSNVFSVIADAGIRRWDRNGDIISLKEYESGNLTKEEQDEINAFAPKVEVVPLWTPKQKKYKGFRSRGKDWAAVFTLLHNDLVPLVGQYMHGVDDIILGLPAGFVDEVEVTIDAFKRCASREMFEETGFRLSHAVALAKHKIPAEPRNSTRGFMPCTGILDPMNLIPSKQKLDEHEEIKVVLMPIREWLTCVDDGVNIALSATETTYRAVRYLQKHHNLLRHI